MNKYQEIMDEMKSLMRQIKHECEKHVFCSEEPCPYYNEDGGNCFIFQIISRVDCPCDWHF